MFLDLFQTRDIDAEAVKRAFERFDNLHNSKTKEFRLDEFLNIHRGEQVHEINRVSELELEMFRREALEKNNGLNYSVIHDPKINDYPSYNSSYWTTLQQIEKWKTQYPNIQMVIDIHRDGAEDDQGNALALSAAVGGESCARLMLVVGTDQGGLSHPNWQENFANALKLQSVLEGMYPGLCRPIDLRTERFNQHAAPGSILIEVGSHGNTLPQAIASAKLLGTGIAAMLSAAKAHGK